MTTAVRTVAVLGPRDSAARAVAEAVSASTATAAVGDGRARMRVVVDAEPGDRPDVAVLVVDAVCPIRPDDVEVARGVAARIPLVVTLAGRTTECTPDALAENQDVTSRRLADAGVHAPVRVVDERSPGDVARLVRTLEDPAGGTRPSTSPSPTFQTPTFQTPTSPSPTSQTPTSPNPAGPKPPAPQPASAPPSSHHTSHPTNTVDWLLARRTEAITTRSHSLRQDVQALRIDLTQDLHRALRDLGGRTREEIGAAPRSRLDEIARTLSEAADAAVTAVISRADVLVDGLVARHLGATAPATPRIPAPPGGIRLSAAPRHRGEELLVLVMGAAGGTGVGRMLLAPLADIPGLAAALLPLALAAGLALGWTTVTVRRTQTLRNHMIAVVTDRLAGLRAEAEQTLGARLLTAESTITDGFAHDPGPRVSDLERRIRRLRLGTAAPAPAPAPAGRGSS